MHSGPGGARRPHACIYAARMTNTGRLSAARQASRSAVGSCASRYLPILLGANDLNSIGVISPPHPPLFAGLNLSLSLYVRNYKRPD